MEFQVENTSSTLRKLSITVPAAEVMQSYDKVCRKIGRAARLPGFRPGKIPRSLLERHFAAEIKQEVEQDLVQNTLSKALTESKTSLVGRPTIDPGDLKPGDNFTYSANVDYQPEIKLTRYNHLVVAPVEVTVEDSEIEKELKELQQRAGQIVPVLLRDVVAENDLVQLDYEIYLNGQVVPGSQTQNALIGVSDADVIPELAKGLIGAKVPGELEIPVDFKDDFSVKELAGQKGIFKVKLRELKHKEIPSLDDELAKDIGLGSLAELTEKVRTDIKARKDREAKSLRRENLLKALVEANPFDLSPVLIEAQASRMVSNALQSLQRMTGNKMPFPEIDTAGLIKASSADAEQHVRSGMLLLEVAKAENIRVEDSELDAFVERVLNNMDQNNERLRAQLASDEAHEKIYFDLLEDKTVEFLISRASGNAAEAEAAMLNEKAVAANNVVEPEERSGREEKVESHTNSVPEIESEDLDEEAPKKVSHKTSSKPRAASGAKKPSGSGKKVSAKSPAKKASDKKPAAKSAPKTTKKAPKKTTSKA